MEQNKSEKLNELSASIEEVDDNLFSIMTTVFVLAIMFPISFSSEETYMMWFGVVCLTVQVVVLVLFIRRYLKAKMARDLIVVKILKNQDIVE